SDELQAFYKHMIEASRSLDYSLGNIRQELRESGSQTGAFICEYIVFKEIYNLQMRNLERSGTTMFLGDDFDFEKFPACREMMDIHKKWAGYDNGRIKIDVSIHGEYTSSYQLWDAYAEYAINEGLQMQVHLSETKKEQDECVERHGLTPAQVLDCHHVFDVPTTAAHCVWLTEDDMKLLAKRRVSAVHCPTSNMKLASGFADVMGMVRAGMNVCLGTDSVASNNNHDLFEEIKAAALMAKAKTGDPTAVPAEAALMMATVCGAKAQGREKECGMIKEGMDADLILLDFNQPHLIPCHNVLSHLVYAVSGHDVAMTMVRGKVLYMDGRFPTIDLPAVMKELHDYAIPTVFREDEKESAE
ncbi:MAG: amidohydrolase family protein, partial [Clostridia bacterium]|nr:amidohydrolase family protein [Clostridia bacterium]